MKKILCWVTVMTSLKNLVKSGCSRATYSCCYLDAVHSTCRRLRFSRLCDFVAGASTVFGFILIAAFCQTTDLWNLPCPVNLSGLRSWCDLYWPQLCWFQLVFRQLLYGAFAQHNKIMHFNKDIKPSFIWNSIDWGSHNKRAMVRIAVLNLDAKRYFTGKQ